jgi:plasmid stabilization system protein ParE
MVKKIIWSPKAADNLEEICDFIGEDSDYYARVFAQRIIDEIEKIPDFPNVGRIVPEYQQKNLREKIFQSYRIVYRIKPDTIEIVAIVHGARLLHDI